MPSKPFSRLDAVRCVERAGHDDLAVAATICGGCAPRAVQAFFPRRALGLSITAQHRRRRQGDSTVLRDTRVVSFLKVLRFGIYPSRRRSDCSAIRLCNRRTRSVGHGLAHRCTEDLRAIGFVACVSEAAAEVAVAAVDVGADRVVAAVVLVADASEVGTPPLVAHLVRVVAPA